MANGELSSFHAAHRIFVRSVNTTPVQDVYRMPVLHPPLRYSKSDIFIDPDRVHSQMRIGYCVDSHPRVW
jgi:hypothetical protein